MESTQSIAPTRASQTIEHIKKLREAAEQKYGNFRSDFWARSLFRERVPFAVELIFSSIYRKAFFSGYNVKEGSKKINHKRANWIKKQGVIF